MNANVVALLIIALTRFSLISDRPYVCMPNELACIQRVAYGLLYKDICIDFLILLRETL